MLKLLHNCTHLTQCSKFSKPDFNNTWTVNFRCSSWFRKGRGTRDQIANIHWIIEKAREFQKNIYFCFMNYTKALDCVDHKTGKFFKRWEHQTTLPISWETCMQVKKQQLEPYMRQLIGSKSRKEYDRAVCRHRLFNLYAEHITRIAGLDEWQTGIKSTTSDMQMLPP